MDSGGKRGDCHGSSNQSLVVPHGDDVCESHNGAVDDEFQGSDCTPGA